MLPLFNADISDYVRFDGIAIRCFAPKNRLVFRWLEDRQTPPQREASERARLLMKLGLGDRGYEYYQLGLIQDLASVFQNPS